METVLSELTVSITDLRKKPGELLREAHGQTVAILSHNKPAAYLVSPETYRTMLEALEDRALGVIVEARKAKIKHAKTVKLDQL